MLSDLNAQIIVIDFFWWWPCYVVSCNVMIIYPVVYLQPATLNFEYYFTPRSVWSEILYCIIVIMKSQLLKASRLVKNLRL